jgi:aquaglyceroporin related protein, other eukaryote
MAVYVFSQLMGGLVGAAMVYANYFHAIDIYEGGRGVRTLHTASLFATYAVSLLNYPDSRSKKNDTVKSDDMTNMACFFSECLATAIMMIVVLAAIDKRNNPPLKGLLPLVIFIVVLGIGISLGMETGTFLKFLTINCLQVESACRICIEPGA